MSEIIASPSVRAKARERGINLEQRAKQLGRSHLTLDDLSDTVLAGTGCRKSHVRTPSIPPFRTAFRRIQWGARGRKRGQEWPGKIGQMRARNP